MARLVIKNGHQKDACYDQIQVRAENEDTTIGLQMFITFGTTYVAA